MADVEDLRALVVHPFLPLQRAPRAARQPSLSAEALDAFHPNAAARALRLVG